MDISWMSTREQEEYENRYAEAEHHYFTYHLGCPVPPRESKEYSRHECKIYPTCSGTHEYRIRVFCGRCDCELDSKNKFKSSTACEERIQWGPFNYFCCRCAKEKLSHQTCFKKMELCDACQVRAETKKTKSNGRKTKRAKSDGGEAKRTKSDGGKAKRTESDSGEAKKTKSDGGEAKRTKSDGGEAKKTKSDGGEAKKTKFKHAEAKKKVSTKVIAPGSTALGASCAPPASRTARRNGETKKASKAALKVQKPLGIQKKPSDVTKKYQAKKLAKVLDKTAAKKTPKKKV